MWREVAGFLILQDGVECCVLSMVVFWFLSSLSCPNTSLQPRMSLCTSHEGRSNIALYLLHE
jgi:hypothetical protein